MSPRRAGDASTGTGPSPPPRARRPPPIFSCTLGSMITWATPATMAQITARAKSLLSSLVTLLPFTRSRRAGAAYYAALTSIKNAPARREPSVARFYQHRDRHDSAGAGGFRPRSCRNKLMARLAIGRVVGGRSLGSGSCPLGPGGLAGVRKLRRIGVEAGADGTLGLLHIGAILLHIASTSGAVLRAGLGTSVAGVRRIGVLRRRALGDGGEREHGQRQRDANGSAYARSLPWCSRRDTVSNTLSTQPGERDAVR